MNHIARMNFCHQGAVVACRSEIPTLHLTGIDRYDERFILKSLGDFYICNNRDCVLRNSDYRHTDAEWPEADERPWSALTRA